MGIAGEETKVPKTKESYPARVICGTASPSKHLIGTASDHTRPIGARHRGVRARTSGTRRDSRGCQSEDPIDDENEPNLCRRTMLLVNLCVGGGVGQGGTPGSCFASAVHDSVEPGDRRLTPARETLWIPG